MYQYSCFQLIHLLSSLGEKEILEQCFLDLNNVEKIKTREMKSLDQVWVSKIVDCLGNYVGRMPFIDDVEYFVNS